MDATLRNDARLAETARDLVMLAPKVARADHRRALRLLADAEAALQKECCVMRENALSKVGAKICPDCEGTGTILFRGQVRHCPRSVGKLCTPKTRKKADKLRGAALDEVEPRIRSHRHEVQRLMDEVRSWISG